MFAEVQRQRMQARGVPEDELFAFDDRMRRNAEEEELQLRQDEELLNMD